MSKMMRQYSSERQMVVSACQPLKHIIPFLILKEDALLAHVTIFEWSWRLSLTHEKQHEMRYKYVIMLKIFLSQMEANVIDQLKTISSC